MDQPNEERDEADADVKPGGCSCGDPFASLPAELRPQPPAKDNGLRQVTCPKCGLVYWTNRETDVCVHCE